MTGWRRDFTAQDLAGIDHRRSGIKADHTLTAGKAAHRDNHRIGRFSDDPFGGHCNSDVNVHAQLTNLPFQPVHHQRQSFPTGRGCRQPDCAAELSIAFK